MSMSTRIVLTMAVGTAVVATEADAASGNTQCECDWPAES